jgi:CRISPR-associated endonuclease Csy4
MSSHHLDLCILPDPEIALGHVLSTLYGRLHLVLARERCETVGVSFPGYDAQRRRLGNCLRLLGASDDLQTLMALPWLGGLRDHLQVGGLALVPADAVPRMLRRVQAKSSPARLRRRQMRRHGLTEEQATARVPDEAAERLDLPFITMTSSSTGQTFRLFLQLGEPLSAARVGRFNSYGLSQTASVPWF